MAAKYPPYVNSYGNLSKLFAEIKKAAVPPKVTNDFVSTVLGLKSTSYRAMIPLMKKLGFIDQSNVPTQPYKDYREDGRSKHVMAEQLRFAYSTLFSANEFAYKLTKDELKSKLQTLTGAAADDEVLPYVVGTFMELAKLSDFEGKHKPKKAKDLSDDSSGGESEKNRDSFNVDRLGLSYTINLNLPATTEIEVFNAIFKSLKENLLGK